MKSLTINQAILYVINSNTNIPFDIVITGFNLNTAVHLSNKSVYNHNYYLYNGYIILEKADDDCTVEYFVCDSNYKIIGSLGSRYDNEIDGDLYTSW